MTPCLCDRVGKPLNDLAMNRQRFMLDNHAAWIAESDRRKLADEFAKEEILRKLREREATDAANPLNFGNVLCLVAHV